MKKEFNIKYRSEIESGVYKVETRDGRSARIVCWDKNGDELYPVIALVKTNQKEVVATYDSTGNCSTFDTQFDLFVTSDKEENPNVPTELVTAVEQIITGYQFLPHDIDHMVWREEAESYYKKCAAKLYEIAYRLVDEEFCKTHECDKSDEDYEKKKEILYYNMGIARAKNMFLESTPKWKVAKDDISDATIEYAIKYPHDGGDYDEYETVEVTNRVRKGEQYFELEDLLELPVEE